MPQYMMSPHIWKITKKWLHHKKKKNHKSIFVDGFVPQELTLWTPEPPVKQAWFLIIIKSNGIRLVLHFNTWVWHLRFAISFSFGTVTRLTLLILLSQFSCACVHVCVSVNWMVTFNCFMDHWIVGHKSFPIGRRQFFNCQINRLWPEKGW